MLGIGNTVRGKSRARSCLVEHTVYWGRHTDKEIFLEEASSSLRREGKGPDKSRSQRIEGDSVPDRGNSLFKDPELGENMTFSAISKKFIRDGWDEGISQRAEVADVDGGQSVFNHQGCGIHAKSPVQPFRYFFLSF